MVTPPRPAPWLYPDAMRFDAMRYHAMRCDAMRSGLRVQPNKRVDGFSHLAGARKLGTCRHSPGFGWSGLQRGPGLEKSVGMMSRCTDTRAHCTRSFPVVSVRHLLCRRVVRRRDCMNKFMYILL